MWKLNSLTNLGHGWKLQMHNFRVSVIQTLYICHVQPPFPLLVQRGNEVEEIFGWK